MYFDFELVYIFFSIPFFLTSLTKVDERENVFFLQLFKLPVFAFGVYYGDIL